MSGGAVVVLAWARETAPGLLTSAAWEAARSGSVFAADLTSPHVAALRADGVEVLPGAPEELAALAGRHGRVVWLAVDEAEQAQVMDLARGAGLPVEVRTSGAARPGSRLLDVVAVMDRLRSPGGCPWDAAQTHDSLKRYLLEETYEAYQALEDDDPVALREELGDVLLQVVFHARLAQESPSPWSVDDVAGDLVDKLVRRHPHVFAGASSDDLEGAWEAGKAVEKGRTSATDGVPLAQPALMLAAKLQSRAGRAGAPVPSYDGLGGQLWDLVARCREQGMDAEAALREVARRFAAELVAAESSARADGEDLAALAPEQWARHWPAGQGAPA